MDYKASFRNKASRHDGAFFEELIEASLFEYESMGLASVQKTPEPMKVLRRLKNGQFVACFTKQAQPDFKGTLCDGHCIVFDAKHTDKDRILQSAVSDEQTAILNTYERMMAKCYIMVSMGFESFYRVPWGIWKNMKGLFGHKYMNLENLASYKVPAGKYIGILEGVEINEDSQDRACISN